MIKVRTGVFETNSSSEHSLAVYPSCKSSADLLGIKQFTYEDDDDDDINKRRNGARILYINEIKKSCHNGVITIDRLGCDRFWSIDSFIGKLEYLIAIVLGTSGTIRIDEVKKNNLVEVLLENAKLAAKHLGVKIKDFKFDSATHRTDGFVTVGKNEILCDVDHGVLEMGTTSSIDGLSFYDILVEPDIEIVYWRNG